MGGRRPGLVLVVRFLRQDGERAQPIPRSICMRLQRSVGFMALVAGAALQFPAVGSAEEKSFEIYGFMMVDYIQDFGRVNPDWEDTLRPSRIPTFS